MWARGCPDAEIDMLIATLEELADAGELKTIEDVLPFVATVAGA